MSKLRYFDTKHVFTIFFAIQGPYVSTIKLAKRAAALRACIQLHQIGELDDNLKPKKVLIDEDTKFLFTHWPENVEKFAGFSKTKRMHKKEVSFVIFVK